MCVLFLFIGYNLVGLNRASIIKCCSGSSKVVERSLSECQQYVTGYMSDVCNVLTCFEVSVSCFSYCYMQHNWYSALYAHIIVTEHFALTKIYLS